MWIEIFSDVSYPPKNIDEIPTRINNSKYFTVLDCKRGFWQIKVSKRTEKYLTFLTLWGRYCFRLASTPEVFQDIINELLKNIPNVECSVDDVLIHAGKSSKLQKNTKNYKEYIA